MKKVLGIVVLLSMCLLAVFADTVEDYQSLQRQSKEVIDSFKGLTNPTVKELKEYAQALYDNSYCTSMIAAYYLRNVEKDTSLSNSKYYKDLVIEDTTQEKLIRYRALDTEMNLLANAIDSAKNNFTSPLEKDLKIVQQSSDKRLKQLKAKIKEEKKDYMETLDKGFDKLFNELIEEKTKLDEELDYKLVTESSKNGELKVTFSAYDRNKFGWTANVQILCSGNDVGNHLGFNLFFPYELLTGSSIPLSTDSKARQNEYEKNIEKLDKDLTSSFPSYYAVITYRINIEPSTISFDPFEIDFRKVSSNSLLKTISLKNISTRVYTRTKAEEQSSLLSRYNRIYRQARIVREPQLLGRQGIGVELAQSLMEVEDLESDFVLEARMNIHRGLYTGLGMGFGDDGIKTAHALLGTSYRLIGFDSSALKLYSDISVNFNVQDFNEVGYEIRAGLEVSLQNTRNTASSLNFALSYSAHEQANKALLLRLGYTLGLDLFD